MSKLDDSRVKRFIADYRKAAFSSLFEDFKKGFIEAESQRRFLSSQTEPAFNVFKILGVSWYEAKTHTPFLRALLDPNGPHEQGAIFLRGFLEKCSRLYSVPVEKRQASNQNRSLM